MDMKPLLPPVTVNGVTISPERIAAEAQNHPAPKGKPGLAWKAAARALALRPVERGRAEVRVGEEGGQPRREGLHQLEECRRMASRGRLLIGSGEASVFRSTAEPSWRIS